TYTICSVGRYYRHLRGVLIEDLVTFSQDSRSSDYGNDEPVPYIGMKANIPILFAQLAVTIVIFEVF
ncbi:MAG: hypothetical protein GY928_26840, partial [Colwellia sp.]|nr:hypothetical protein [Colwellia sp.]